MFNEPFRNDPRIIIENALRGLAVLIAGMLYNIQMIKDAYQALKNGGWAALHHFLQDISSNIPWLPLLGGAALLIIFLCFYGFRRWWCLTFEMKDTTFYRLDNRLIRRSLELSRQNVANVEISRSFLSRLLGTATVKINTNTRSTANSDDVKLYLAYDKAVALQNELKKTLVSHTSQPAADQAPDFVFEADVELILKHTLISISWAQLIFGGVVPLFTIYPLTVTASIGNENLFWATLVGLFIALSFLLLPPIRTFVRYYGFQVKRYGDTLYCRYGLISDHQYTLPLKRLNAVIIQENLLAQLAGMAAVSAINIGMSDEEQNESLILPMLPKDQLFPLFEEALPEYAHELSLKSQPQKALLPIAVSVALFSILPAVIAMIFLPPPFKIFAPLWLVIGILYGLYTYKTPGIASNNRFVFIASGAFDRTTTLIPLNRLQLIEYKSGPLLQLAGLQKAVVHILASSLMSTYSTGTFTPQDLKILKEALLKY